LGAVKAAAACSTFVHRLKLQIGHRDLREEAEMHLSIIIALFGQIELKPFQQAKFDPLGLEAQAAIKTMILIGEHKYAVESLLFEDQRKRRNTSLLVTLSAIFALLCGALLTLFGFFNFTLVQHPLKTMAPFFLGIPWPVIAWSVIGSFASMLHRFNNTPIYEFTDLLKWLVTRPIQGIVLGATFYYIVNTGLFAFASNNPTTDTNGVEQGDYVILLLCFLVGFSDKFANSIFNILVNRFDGSSSNSNNSNSSNNSANSQRKVISNPSVEVSPETVGVARFTEPPNSKQN
jgi:hypothetical protein